jgi:hypothetical protein
MRCVDNLGCGRPWEARQSTIFEPLAVLEHVIYNENPPG